MLIALLGAGAVSPGPGLAALLAVLAGAGAMGVVWAVASARLVAALRAAAAEGPRGAPVPLPALPGLGAVEEELSRLARATEARAALVGRLRAGGEAVVESLPDPLLVLDARLAPIRLNRAARLAFGDGARGRLGALLRHPALAAALDRALAGAGPQLVEVALPGAAHREYAAQALAMDPPLDDGGRVLLVLGDRSGARALDRMRADFVTNASHELRTPLASMMGFVETLRGPAADDPEAQQRFLAIMAEQGERMRRLIDDLLGLSRVEATEHLPPCGEAPLSPLLRGEAAAMEPLFAQRGVRLVLDLPEESLTAAPADADQLAQVARNLLDNALRHAAEEVRLEAFRDGARVGFAVRDDGPGIAREHLPRLTERFFRVDKGRARAQGNTGLGLAIVKHIIQRHRGQLSIESEPGVGATFRVMLPGG
ncbi:ATP-binding protein [Roseococcus sp. MDT2-1-1]|uniref:histidine kinase n=1 Tax=Sabulicella glaciei TaxID=2984948 RepID=A0ABT3P009_9PROT|nr:ATP-binding protein [Roseococcus sp. MDT2-1-1]